MKVLSFFVILSTSLGWAQSAPPAAAGDKPDAVIAIFEDGSKMTQGEFQTLIAVLPDTWRAMAQRDAQRFLHVYGTLLKGAAAARAEKLAEKAPYKQGMEFTLLSTLADYYVRESTSSITVTPEELEKYYNEHKEPFRRIKVSGIFVAFGGAAAAGETAAASANATRIPKSALSEEEAKAKADKLVAQIRGGADFAKLVQQESDDEASKAKGGELGTWRMTDNVPDQLRAGVLSLQEGQISDPIRQAGGFWIVHADAVSYEPLDAVKDSIFVQVQQEKAKDWIQKFDQSTKVEFPKQDPIPPAAPSDLKK